MITYPGSKRLHVPVPGDLADGTGAREVDHPTGPLRPELLSTDAVAGTTCRESA